MNPLLFIVLIIAALGYAGSMNYNDELAQEENYAAKVCAQVWPDYRGIEPECPKPKAMPGRY